MNASIANVTFHRRRTWQDYVRAYRIEVDGAIVGVIRSGGEFRLPIPPGVHRCRATISWTGSDYLEFEVGPGERLDILIQPGTGSPLQRARSTSGYLALRVIKPNA